MVPGPALIMALIGLHFDDGIETAAMRHTIRTGAILNDRGPNRKPLRKLAGLAHGPFLLETAAAEHWTPLRGLKGNGGFRSTFRADGTRFRAGRTGAGGAFGLALLATFRIVLELLVVKEQLLAGCEHEVASAVRALKNLVDEIHPAFLAFAGSTR
jgi:hypothetical protein